MTSAAGSARHRSREVAVQVLFALDVHVAKGPAPPAAQEVFDDVAAHFEMPEAARAFAKELVTGVAQHRDALDALVREAARNWRLERMAVVDRNVLRLAAFELAFSDTPVEVVIDEAVQLAKRYGDDPSPGFVNGVLDGVARATRGAGR
ncbi:MAG: transcription antitermination factor NusB [Myxococcota bacterium]|nr:transcription antitermination factor NusB [Myxococcales bacterium]